MSPCGGTAGRGRDVQLDEASAIDNVERRATMNRRRPIGQPGRQGHLMNRIEKFFGLRGEARVRYKDGEFEVVSHGDFVRCAVTGKEIELPDLRYWSVELQEPYASAEVSLQRYLDVVRNRRSA
ncbi:MAG: DUF2093 domain-containing protein [Hyphomicrobium sp.]